MRSFSLLTLVAGLLTGVVSNAADPPPKSKATPANPERFARLAWTVTEEIVRQHVEPPKQGDVLRSLFKAATENLPPEVAERIAAATSAAELAAAARTLRLKSVEPQGLSPAGAESDLLRSVLPQAAKGVTFTPAAEYKVVEQVNRNRYVGTGIQIGIHKTEKLPELMYCFPDGPAHKAGVRKGDLIVQVDGEQIAAATGLRRTVELLRGEEGTEVTVHVRRPGATETRAVKMVRSAVPFPSVEGLLRRGEEDWDFHARADAPVAYVHLRDLLVSTPHDLKRLERRLQREGFRALVLDLRACAGERAHDALLVADAFLDAGVIWRERDAQGRVTEHRADKDCVFRGWPIVVLTLGARAAHVAGGSGADLLAAALQDNGRAPVVGDATNGNCYTFEYFRLPENQGALRIPVRVAERAGGKAKAAGGADKAAGVPADYPVSMTKEQAQRWLEWRRDVELANPTDGKAPEDAALAKAVQLLRAILKDAKPAG